MRQFFRQFLKPKYQTWNQLEIKKANLLANYQFLQSLQATAEIWPVVKSNAYGHGLKEVCTILNDSPAKMVVVDSFPEAQIALRYFKGRVLIIGAMPLEAYRFATSSRLDLVVYNIETLRALPSNSIKRPRIHLFVNTGMNREGIQDLSLFLKDNEKDLYHCQVVGLCSHFASADEQSDLNRRQEEKFENDWKILQAAGYKPLYRHLGNSAAIFTNTNPHLNAFRSGLAFYGYNPFAPTNENFNTAQNLKPALRLTSTVVACQDLKAGETVSYNETYHATGSERIAVIPFGYYEGLDRNLSNKASLIFLNGLKRIPLRVAGRICMNLTCLAAGATKIQLGDKIEIISLNNSDINSLNNLSVISGRTIYELLVRWQANIRRKIN
jgi:alanine racemase